MSWLKKYSVNIDTYLEKNNNQIVLSSNKDIQEGFKRKEYGLVSSLVEYFTKEKECLFAPCVQCYISMLKSMLHLFTPISIRENFDFLTDCFQDGILQNVLLLIMTDCCSFLTQLLQNNLPKFFSAETINHTQWWTTRRKATIDHFGLVFSSCCSQRCVCSCRLYWTISRREILPIT